MGTNYSFVTQWRVEGSLEKAWGAIYYSEKWPEWWRGVEKVEQVRPATGSNSVGSVYRYTWKSALPYRLTFDMAVTKVEPLSRIESTAQGELEGTGVWTLVQDGPVVDVRYDWNVRTTKPWMNILAPIARPFFRWNHDVVMAWGYEGLTKLLKL